MRSLLYASLATTALAFPLFPHRRSPQPPSYNVVPVSGHDLSSEPEEHLQPRDPIPDPRGASPSYSVVAVDGANAPPPAQIQTIVTTRLSTIVITTAETPQTVVVTVTDATAPAPTGPANNDATVTVTAPAGPGETQTRPYDNGMWHTTYYYTTVVPTPAPAPAPAPAPENTNNNNAVAPQGDDTTNNAPWDDASDDLPGVQMIGGAPIRANPDAFAASAPASEANGDDTNAKLAGQWAPWNGDNGSNGGQEQGQGQPESEGGTGAEGVSFGDGALAAGRPGSGS